MTPRPRCLCGHPAFTHNADGACWHGYEPVDGGGCCCLSYRPSALRVSR